MNVNKKRLNEILNNLPFDNRDILLVGGVVRYITEIENDYRDIDVIVNNSFVIPNNIEYKINMYYGIKLLYNNMEIDVWKLKNHIIPCDNFEEIQETWRLSIDALYYDVEKDVIYDKYFDKSLKINWSNPIKDVEKEYINLKLSKFQI